MKYFTSLLIVLVLSIFATAQEGKKLNADSVQIRNTIMSFNNWYLKHHAKLNSFELYQGVSAKEGPPYKINWKEAEQYFNYIRSAVPQLGKAYIENQRAFLKRCDSAFKVDLESDIPYGFDYDWYTNTQEEPRYLVEGLKNSKRWLVSVKGSIAVVDVIGEEDDGTKKTEISVICYIMKKEAGKWKIAEIGCPVSAVLPSD